MDWIDYYICVVCAIIRLFGIVEAAFCKRNGKGGLMMKGLVYQLKGVRKDKFCILSFFLPVIVAIALNIAGSIDLSSLGGYYFAWFVARSLKKCGSGLRGTAMLRFVRREKNGFRQLRSLLPI